MIGPRRTAHEAKNRMDPMDHLQRSTPSVSHSKFWKQSSNMVKYGGNGEISLIFQPVREAETKPVVWGGEEAGGQRAGNPGANRSPARS